MACDAEDCGFQMLNDDEIVTSMQEESDPVDDETDQDKDNNNNERSKSPSNADVFSALETAMEWFEKQSECCPTQLLLLKRIRDLAAKKRRCTMLHLIILNHGQVKSELVPLSPTPHQRENVQQLPVHDESTAVQGSNPRHAGH
ncbi:uncharacterized protein TNCV_3916051 [Trichonephila clavipes]|nr:uncharacterized protein TNCV_3916051 [Trichonephila clavipes]